jgi:hypothetical protein
MTKSRYPGWRTMTAAQRGQDEKTEDNAVKPEQPGKRTFLVVNQEGERDRHRSDHKEELVILTANEYTAAQTLAAHNKVLLEFKYSFRAKPELLDPAVFDKDSPISDCRNKKKC